MRTGQRTVRQRGRRGIAMLLVMIALTVCLVMVSGFLASQSTAIGITQNERNFAQCDAVARSGVDLCVWMMRNKSDWRRTMPIGSWLSNYAVAGGTVTVTAADGDGTGSFADDNTQPVVLTSVGYYNGLSTTVRAKVGPTGGGAVFAKGNFSVGKVVLGKDWANGNCLIDSYNSAYNSYSVFTAGYSAPLTTNANVPGSLTVYCTSTYYGSVAFGPGTVLGSAVVLSGVSPWGPSNKSAAPEVRVPGQVIPPSKLGLQSAPAINQDTFATISGGNEYPAITIGGSGVTHRFNASGVAHVTGNFYLKAGATLQVNDGVAAILYVDGSVTVTGRITCVGTGTLTLYAGTDVTVNGGGYINPNAATSPKAFTLMGLATCTSIKLDSASICGAIFAPQADLVMTNGTPRLYGGVVVNSITMTNNATIHWDDWVKGVVIHNIYGGSAAPGSPDYSMVWQ